MLLSRRRRGDAARARDLMTTAATTARTLGMATVLERLRELTAPGAPVAAR
jgi:hypothetical protein